MAIDPPWRFDPFRNLVDFAFGHFIVFIWTMDDLVYAPIPEIYYSGLSGPETFPGSPGYLTATGTDVAMPSPAATLVSDRIIAETFSDGGVQLPTPYGWDLGGDSGFGAAYLRDVDEGGNHRLGEQFPAYGPAGEPPDSEDELVHNVYQRTFVFDAPDDHSQFQSVLSSVTASAPIFDAPETITGNAFGASPPDPYSETFPHVLTSTGSAVFTVYIFSKSDVVYYPTDPAFPLRARLPDGTPDLNPAHSPFFTFPTLLRYTATFNSPTYSDGAGNVLAAFGNGGHVFKYGRVLFPDGSQGPAVWLADEVDLGAAIATYTWNKRKQDDDPLQGVLGEHTTNTGQPPGPIVHD